MAAMLEFAHNAVSRVFYGHNRYTSRICFNSVETNDLTLENGGHLVLYPQCRVQGVF